MKRKYKLLLSVITILTIVIAAVCINESKKPKLHYNPEINAQIIEYNGKAYFPIGNSGAFEYRCDKTLAKGTIYSISSLENDENINFLSYSEWQYHEIFTCIEDYEKNTHLVYAMRIE